MQSRAGSPVLDSSRLIFTLQNSPHPRHLLSSKVQHSETHRIMSGSRVPVTMRDFFFDDPFFKSSWDDFDKVREAMFLESRDMWKKFDDDFRNMACMSNNIMLESSEDDQKQEALTNNEARSLMRQDSKSRWENGWMFPRRWMLPALNTDFSNNMDIFKSKTPSQDGRMDGCFPGGGCCQL